MNTLFQFLFLILTPFIVWGQGNSINEIEIEFHHKVDGQSLVLDSFLYKNAIGQSFSITKLKYYISDVELIKNDGKSHHSNEVFLIDEEVEKTKHILLKNIPDEPYQRIVFKLGIDSLRNCSGAQDGALDPIHGMFWTWNTGYIFLKLEGLSPASSAPGKIFEYHIGGYKSPVNCIKKIQLPFKKNIHFTQVHKFKIDIEMNVGELLKNPINIDFSEIPIVADLKNALKIADNYSDMFKISEE